MRPFIATFVMILAPLVAEAQSSCRAVMVGVSKYSVRGVDWLKYAHLDAQAFAGWVKQRGCQSVAFEDDNAKVASVRQALRDALQTAGPLEDVFLFLSGRGIGTPDAHAGFILLWDSKESEPVSTALSTDELNLYIKQSRARRIFLFADLRASDRLQPNNLIQFKLKDLAPAEKGPTTGKFSEILGSQPRQFSGEVSDPKNAKAGNGAFSLVLMKELQGGRANTIQELFDELKKQLPGTSPTRQSPWQFGPVIGPLKAATPTQVRRRNPFGAVLIRASYVPGRDEMVANETAEEDAVALENEGQAVLTQYGEGDHFPSEPGLLQGDFERAATAFQKALDIRKSLPLEQDDMALLQSLEARSLFCRGRALLFDSTLDYKQALDLLNSSSQKRGDYPEPWNAIGVAYLEHAAYTDAQANLRKAIQLAPDWAYPRHNLALTYAEQGDYAAAEKEYREAIRRTPYQPYLYYNLGVLLHRINRKADARTEYNLAIRTFEEQAAIVLDHATRFSDDRNDKEADQARQHRAVLLKNEAEVYNALGAIAQAEGHAGKAREAYAAAISHDPDLILATYNLGTLEARKNPDTAIGLWQRVLAKDKDYLPAHQRLAETWQRLGKLEQSAGEYREVLRIQPDSSEARGRLPEVLGDLNAARGDRVGACREYGVAESATPSNPRELQKKKKRVC